MIRRATKKLLWLLRQWRGIDIVILVYFVSSIILVPRLNDLVYDPSNFVIFGLVVLYMLLIAAVAIRQDGWSDIGDHFNLPSPPRTEKFGVLLTALAIGFILIATVLVGHMIYAQYR